MRRVQWLGKWGLCLVLGTICLGCQGDQLFFTQTDKPIVWGQGMPPMPRFAPLVFRANDVPETFVARSTPQVVSSDKAKKAKSSALPLAHLDAKNAPKRLGARPNPRQQVWAQTIAAYYKGGEQARVLVETDKPMYKPGETVWVRSCVLLAQRNQPWPGKDVVLYEWVGPRGNVVQKAQGLLKKGHSRFQVKLPKGSAGGEYLIRVTSRTTKAKGERKVFVNAYQAPRIQKTLEFLRRGYSAGDTVQAKMTIKRATGAVLANHQVDVQVQLAGKTVKVFPITTNAKGLALLSFTLPKLLNTDDGLLSVRVPLEGVTETIARTIPLATRQLKVGLFPEGGAAIVGLSARVYVAVRRKKDGKPQDFRGVVEDKQGKVVAKVRSFHDGMGRFIYTPQKKKGYHLRIVEPKGVLDTFALPAAKEEGIAMQWVDDFSSKNKALHLLVSAKKPRFIMVSALQHETLIGQQRFALQPRVQRLTLRLKKQWRGVLRVSIFDQKLQPLAERLVFRHRGKGLQIKIRTTKTSYQPRQTVEVKLQVRLPSGKAVRNASLGVSVVDSTVLSFADDQEPNWLTQRFLSQQLIGEIHKPNFYFKKNESKAPRALDLVMGTHGWRSFSWEQTLQGARAQAAREKRLQSRREMWVSKVERQYEAMLLAKKMRAITRRGVLGTLGGGGGLGTRGFGAGGSGAGGFGSRGSLGSSGSSGSARRIGRFWRGVGGVRKQRRVTRAKTRARRAKRKGRRSRRVVRRPRRVTPSRLALKEKEGGSGKQLSANARSAPRPAKVDRFARSAGKARTEVKQRSDRARRSQNKSPVRVRSKSKLVRKKGKKRDVRRRTRAKNAVDLDRLRRGMGGLGLLRSRRQGSLGRRGSTFQGREPRVNLGRVEIHGALDRGIIQRVIRRKRNLYRHIYMRELLRNPNARGRITIRFEIGPEGLVTQVRLVQKTIGSAQVMARALKRTFQRMRFPRPKGGGRVIVRYPMVFSQRTLERRRSPFSTFSSRQGTSPNIPLVKVRHFPTKFYNVPKKGEAVRRSDFRETLFWAPHLKTDGFGEVKFRFGLNDSVTSFRIYVAGIGGGLLGVKTKSIRSQRPFFLAVKFPMEVSEGDAMVLPLTLRNQTQRTLKVRVQVPHGQMFQLMENPIPSSISLKKGEARTYFYPFRVKGKQGQETLVFVAESEGISDSLERTISIEPRGYPQTFVKSGTAMPGKPVQWSFVLPNDVSKSSIRSDLSVYPNPLGALVKATAGIIRKPYGCFEQTSSSNYPNVMALRFLKSQDIRRPALFAKSAKFIAQGYKRLVSFEVKGGGFDWFGSAPAHEGLTAYGLMQFADMKPVYAGVEKAMLDRNVRWLHSRRDGQGGFLRANNYKNFGRSDKSIFDAYITYALSEAGRNDLAKEIGALEDRALGSKDPYFMALVLNALCNVRGKQHAVTRDLAKRLFSLQEKSGEFVGKLHSITYSLGRNLHIETTALVVMAMLRMGVAENNVRRAILWLRDQRSSDGSFGTTQATVLALRAIVAYESKYTRKRVQGKVGVTLNGKREHLGYTGSTIQKSNAEVAKHLRPGANQASLLLESEEPVPYSFGVHYFTFQPNNAFGAAVRIQTKLSQDKVKMGEPLRLTVTLENTWNKGLPMTLARVRFPGALRLLPKQLKELKKKGVFAFFETHPREVTLYFRGMAPREKKVIRLDLIARVTGNYNSGASSAYLYYNDDKKMWSAPLQISVRPSS